MRKLLLWLLGLLLMGILAYFCFTSRSAGIKEHLVSDVQSAYSAQQMDWVQADLKGNCFDMTRVLTLEGTAPSIELKEKAGAIAAGIAGVAAVKNNLQVMQEVLPTKKMLDVEEISTQASKEPMEIAKVIEEERINPYTLQASKSKDGIVTLEGYVIDEQMHHAVVDKAQMLFGETNVVDRLKEAKGAAKAWDSSIILGLENLAEVEYGELAMSGTDYHFKGYVADADKKASLIQNLTENLDGRYLGVYMIDAPAKKPVEIKKEIVKEVMIKPIEKGLSCQKEFEKIMMSGKVHFAYNKAGIKPESFALLNAIATASKECADEVITIGGHTDSIGSKEYNQMLSTQRANSVKRYLISQGVEANRIEAQGYGESHPIADNMVKEGRAKNRRIEIGVKGVEK
jgi:outer membrane protein OmpA-like peptidoglycan-associated protein/osmotically-inducible protein OsmY